ncbi:helix-turn-helix transcriptional regulator [Parafrankia sp. FMc2]|uniref:helix-turn-helix transcriptional regulator n=1 Tax=Parafrankia sp. FMc2 TaxID=3233196 RepID=UPI0034D4438C
MNVTQLAEQRRADGVEAALVAVHEVLVGLQELGDLARRARSGLPSGQPRPGGPDSAEQTFPPRRAKFPVQPPYLSTQRLPTSHLPMPHPAQTNPHPGDILPAQRKLLLTHRQQEVLDLLTQGLSNRRIGRSLHIAEQTVKAHLHMIYRKLGAADRTEAVVIALREGLASSQRPPGPPPA